MNKLRFKTGAKAVGRSAQAAEAKGHEMTSGATQLLWSVFKDKDGFYLEIPKEETYLLTEDETNQLKD